MPDRGLTDLRPGEIVTHPWTTATVVIGVVGGVLQVPLVAALWDVLWSQAGALFAALSVTGFTLAPEVPWLPTQTIQVAALVAGGLFVLTRLHKVWTALREQLLERFT